MSLNRYGVPTTRWAILVGLCSITAGMLSYLKVQQHSFVSTSDFEFVFLQRIALGAFSWGDIGYLVASSFMPNRIFELVSLEGSIFALLIGTAAMIFCLLAALASPREITGSAAKSS